MEEIILAGDGLPVDVTDPWKDCCPDIWKDSCLDIWKDSSGKFRLTRFDWGHESSGSYVFPTLTEAVDAAQMCSRLCCIRFAIGAPLIAEELRRTLPAELGQLIGSLNIVGEDGELCINLDPRFEDQGALEAITSAAEAICRGHIGVRAQWAW